MSDNQQWWAVDLFEWWEMTNAFSPIDLLTIPSSKVITKQTKRAN